MKTANNKDNVIVLNHIALVTPVAKKRSFFSKDFFYFNAVLDSGDIISHEYFLESFADEARGELLRELRNN